jgi:hypothetical protein
MQLSIFANEVLASGYSLLLCCIAGLRHLRQIKVGRLTDSTTNTISNSEDAIVSKQLLCLCLNSLEVNVGCDPTARTLGGYCGRRHKGIVLLKVGSNVRLVDSSW